MSWSFKTFIRDQQENQLTKVSFLSFHLSISDTQSIIKQAQKLFNTLSHPLYSEVQYGSIKYG